MTGSAADRPFGTRAVLFAGALAAALLLALASSAAPQLHEWIHSDSAAPTHQCAVTLMSHGQCDNAVTPLPSLDGSLPRGDAELLRDRSAIVALGVESSILEHAPPLFS
jgi:hypothetical protein